MNEPQVWTLIGLFAATMATMVTLVLMTINAKFDRMEARLDARFERIEYRLDGLDRDVNGLTRRMFGIDGE